MAGYDYTEYLEKTPSRDLLTRISQKAAELTKKKQAVLEIEARLKQAQKEVEFLEEIELPTLMQEAGQKELTTIDNLKLKMEHQIFINVSKERKAKAIEWLDANGHGGLVKRQVIIRFNRTEMAEVEKLLNVIKNDWPNYAVDLDVNSATLRALIKSRLREGLPVPSDIFGVYEKTTVKVKED